MDKCALTCDNDSKDPGEWLHTPGAWSDWLEPNMMDATARTEAWRKLISRRTITESGCWEWGGTRRNGYGRIWLDGRLRTAHRVVAHMVHGLDLDDRWTLACHRCDNPPCFNPDHLFLGTPLDNDRDKIEKGRAKYRTGPKDAITLHPHVRACVVCGGDYSPSVDRRGTSKVCSKSCLNELKAINGRRRTYKLTVADVHEVRASLERGERGIDISARMGISRPMISNIKNGKTWGHV